MKVGISPLSATRMILEARVGIEPTHKGFADLSLTTWVPRLNLSSITNFSPPCQAAPFSSYRIWSVTST